MSSLLWHDLKSALRTIGRRPASAITACLMLALGIGVNAAIFSIADAVILRPLPYANSGRLVHLETDFRGLGIPNVGISVVEYKELRDRSGVFENLSFVWPMTGNLTGVNRPERIEALAVGEDYFRILGPRAVLGRTFQASDVRPEWSDYTVLSYGGWKRLFGSDPNVVGRKVYMDYDRYVILGVTPPEFHHPGSTLQGEVDFWILGGMGKGLFADTPRTRRWLPAAIGTLKPGMTLEQAQSRLESLASARRRDYAGDYPAGALWTPRITPLQKELAGASGRILVILLGTVGVVLLLCCVTVSNLLLAKACARRREFAIRAALGANPGRLVRLFLIESLVLAFTAGIAGTVLAAVVTPLLVRFAPLNLPGVNPIGVNGSVLAFSAVVSFAAALLAGVIPALQVTRFGVLDSLRSGGRTMAGGGRAQGALVIGQMAFALILLVGAGLLLKSFWNLLQVDPGFKAGGVLVGSIWLPPPTKDADAVRKYDSDKNRNVFFRELLGRLRALPGVQSAAIGAGDSVPLTGWNATTFGLEDDSVPQGESLTAQMTSISPDFLDVLRLPLITGRSFNEGDDRDYRVALIDRTMARRFWSNRNPIGKRIRLGPQSAPQWWTIVGVVGNMKTNAFESPDAPHVYLSLYQRSDYGVTVFLRAASSNPQTLGEALRREIRAIDPDLSVFGVRTMDAVVSRSLAHRRFILQVIAGFALLALTLSGLGVYGVTAYQVAQRRREIGIRIALGARPWQVLRTVLKRAVLLAVSGLAIGVAGAVAFARFLSSLLFDVTSTDIATYVSVSALLMAAVILASYGPANRATEIDPATTLRAE